MIDNEDDVNDADYWPIQALLENIIAELEDKRISLEALGIDEASHHLDEAIELIKEHIH